MRLTRLLRAIFLLTAVGTVYIHMQMQIYRLAYEAKTREKQIRILIEENGNVTYNILTLKSANNLGFKMLAEESGMQFMHPDSIMEVSAPEFFLREEAELEQEKSSTKTPLLSWLSFGRTAEARAFTSHNK